MKSAAGQCLFTLYTDITVWFMYNKGSFRILENLACILSSTGGKYLDNQRAEKAYCFVTNFSAVYITVK